MLARLGTIQKLVRYPVKSMAGIATESAVLGWHGLQGDRRLAFRRVGNTSSFPWLNASKLAEMVLYQPLGIDESEEEPIPTHVRTPEGNVLPLDSPQLRSLIENKFGGPIELMKLKNGIFDDASVSVISTATIATVSKEVGDHLDVRRFRPNILIATDGNEPFPENKWIGGRLFFGNDDTGPVVSLTARDLRCVMINIDPDSGEKDPRILTSTARLNQSNAGAYGTVIRGGLLSVGQPVKLIIETRD